MGSRDGAVQVEVRAHPAPQIPTGSVFKSLAEASKFFERGSAGYSVTKSPDRYDGLELHTSQWQVAPLEIESVQSSFFDDSNRFPKGTIYFDCALMGSVNDIVILLSDLAISLWPRAKA
jgi:hypothetical protein